MKTYIKPLISYLEIESEVIMGGYSGGPEANDIGNPDIYSQPEAGDAISGEIISVKSIWEE